MPSSLIEPTNSLRDLELNSERQELSALWQCTSCLEQSATACHIYNITVYLPQPPEDTPLEALLPLLHLP